MRIAHNPATARAIVRAWHCKGERIGFVPTMGALHEGHRSLLRRARRECDRLVASVFVNPLQFAPSEDLSRYPRTLAKDRSMLIDEGCDLLYNPSARAMYPPGFASRVEVQGLSEGLEGASRPGHFAGVTTVVAKLLITLEPDCLYLGQKDAQQAAVLSRMVRDLDLGTRVIVCPTVRERDGLALSSRNAYLTRKERAWAPNLHRALREAAEALRTGGTTPRGAEAAIRRRLAGGPGRLDYARAVDAETLGPTQAGRPILLSLAYHLGRARLIDNVVVRRGRKG